MMRRELAFAAALLLAASPAGVTAQDWLSEPAEPHAPATPDTPRAPRAAPAPGNWSSMPEPRASLADETIDRLGRCRAAGVTSMVDCLRNWMSSVTIRRLEACIRSETIPHEQDEVRACLSAGQW